MQIFDAYGNALEGWKVTFEVVAQGTTTAGTVPTYHPWAHFAEWLSAVDAHHHSVAGPRVTPEHNYLTNLKGVGDLHPGLNVNPVWNAAMNDAGTPSAVGSTASHWFSDDDYSWGYTLNGQINFTNDPKSAAYTTLVLDETYGELEARLRDQGANHAGCFTSLVNVHIWKPAETALSTTTTSKSPRSGRWSLRRSTASTWCRS